MIVTSSQIVLVRVLTNHGNDAIANRANTQLRPYGFVYRAYAIRPYTQTNID